MDESESTPNQTEAGGEPRRWVAFARAHWVWGIVGVMTIAAAVGISLAAWNSYTSQYNKDGWNAAAAELDHTKGELADSQADAAQAKDALMPQEELTSRKAALDAQQSDVAAREDAVKKAEDTVKQREDAVTAAEGALKANQFGDGILVVGRDIQPGVYRTSGAGSCYYARLRGGGGTVGDIISNNNVEGPATVTIAPSDWGFESSRCGMWTKIG